MDVQDVLRKLPTCLISVSNEQKKQVFTKILDSHDSKERSELIEFYKVIIENEEQTKQKNFLNRMIAIFFLFGIVAVGATAWIDDNTNKSIVVGVGGFLLGASAITVIVPTLKKNE